MTKKKTQTGSVAMIFSMFFITIGILLVFWYFQLKAELLTPDADPIQTIGNILAFSSFAALPLGLGLIFIFIGLVLFMIFLAKRMGR